MFLRFSAKLWRCGDVMLKRFGCDGTLLGGDVESDLELSEEVTFTSLGLLPARD